MTNIAAADRAEQLRLEALARFENKEFEASLVLLDEALGHAESDEFRELVNINKAGVLIEMREDGPEVHALAQIVLRRPNLTHTFLAAYNLQNRFAIEQEFRKAHNYVRIALEAAVEAANDGWKIGALNATGNICVYESRTAEAITHYGNLLDLIGSSESYLLFRAIAKQNLGYCLIIEGEADRGVALIHESVDEMERAGAPGHLPEAYIDLCYGYLETGDLDRAWHFGTLGLELAADARQVRNAHYLLGEVAYKQGDQEAAENHFEQLGSYYPDFPNLKNILMALDLRKVVNFKL